MLKRKTHCTGLYAQKVVDPVLFRQEMNALQKQAESCRMGKLLRLDKEIHGETEIIAIKALCSLQSSFWQC